MFTPSTVLYMPPRWIRFVTPAIYAAGVLPVLTAAEVAIAILQTVRPIRMPNLPGAVTTLVLAGILVYPVTSAMLAALEQLRSPRWIDHVRQSVFYYCALLLGVAGLVAPAGPAPEERQNAVAVVWVLLVTAFVAIGSNVAVLWRRHQRAVA